MDVKLGVPFGRGKEMTKIKRELDVDILKNNIELGNLYEEKYSKIF